MLSRPNSKITKALEINVRQRAIASFFEWEKLTQAAAGRHATLGNVIGTFLAFDMSL
jgi:hypothetical protein